MASVVVQVVQAAEKRTLEVGGSFNSRTNPIKSTWASAPEECFGISFEIALFPAASVARPAPDLCATLCALPWSQESGQPKDWSQRFAPQDSGFAHVRGRMAV